MLPLRLGVNLELPLAVEVQPRLALEIWSWMLGPRNVAQARQADCQGQAGDEQDANEGRFHAGHNSQSRDPYNRQELGPASTILLDEPELGLHPYAITPLAVESAKELLHEQPLGTPWPPAGAKPRCNRCRTDEQPINNRNTTGLQPNNNGAPRYLLQRIIPSIRMAQALTGNLSRNRLGRMTGTLSERTADRNDPLNQGPPQHPTSVLQPSRSPC